MKSYFSPSLMCMDLLNVEEQIKILNDRVDFYHVDIMDGHYVKNITLSPDFVKSVSKVATKPIDCHLMVTNPENYIDVLIEAGATYISPQAETINAQAFRLINQIKDKGAKVGIVLNPATPVSYIGEYIHLIDKITVMTVDPGYAGQKFIDSMLSKISQLKDLKESEGYKYLIEIDGSCNKGTFKRLHEAGAEVYIVGGSGLFGLDNDLEKAWDTMMTHFDQETRNVDHG